MITLVNKIKNHLLKNHDVKTKSSFLLPLLLHVIGKDLTPETEPIVSFAFSIFGLSLIAISCFTSVCVYLLSIYLISKYDIESKFQNYPRFKKIIKFNKNASIFLIVMEIVIGLTCLIGIALLSGIVGGVILTKL